jgi:hypothetical protein
MIADVKILGRGAIVRCQPRKMKAPLCVFRLLFQTCVSFVRVRSKKPGARSQNFIGCSYAASSRLSKLVTQF